MAAFDNLNQTPGGDLFGDLYNKYNDTVTALKGGATDRVLAGNGIGSVPTYKSIWEDFIIVGSGGGAPAFQNNYGQGSVSSGDVIRFKKSDILKEVCISGTYQAVSTSLNTNTPFTLPAGYRPLRPVAGYARIVGNERLLSVTINTNGTLRVENFTGMSITSGAQIFINIIFPLD